MEPINCFFQLLGQPVKSTTEQLTTEPSGSTPPVYQKQWKKALYWSSAKKRKVKIFWACKCVLSDMSAFSVGRCSDLFAVMFSDSQIAKDFQMNRTKMTYLINFATASYSWKMLLVNWAVVIIIQFRLTNVLMKPPKPVRWVYMFVIGVNLKIKYVYVT